MILNNEYSIKAIDISGLITLIHSFHSSLDLLNLQIEANALSDSANLDYDYMRGLDKYGLLKVS